MDEFIEELPEPVAQVTRIRSWHADLRGNDDAQGGAGYRAGGVGWF